MCFSVHRGVSVQAAFCPGGGIFVQQQGLCPAARSLSRVISIQGGFCPGGGSLSRGSLYRGISVQGVSVHGGLCLEGSMSWGSLSIKGLCQGEPRTVKSGHYAFYGNVFLFYQELTTDNSKKFTGEPPYGRERALRILQECILVLSRIDH